MRCLSCGFDTTDLRAALPLVVTLLQCEGRVSYQALQYEFGLDTALLEALRAELVFKGLARDEQGQGLVWQDAAHLLAPPAGATPQQLVASPPVSLAPLRMKTAGPILPTPQEPTVAPTLLRAIQTPTAERRQLTVMFCDVVGSTALSGQLDPEDLREVIRAYQETAAGVIQQYEGHIAQYLGDGLLVYFGYPQAHEGDAQRAVHTGLGIVSALEALNSRLQTDYSVGLAVRIGIHTGPVVVGQMGGGGRHEQLALGETPNIAARLEGLAGPDTIVISAATAKLVQNVFALEEMGLQILKGIAEPLLISSVLGPLEEQPDGEDTTPERAIFLVGRDEEVGLLHRRWEQSKEGIGQVVLISGEAGIGKSSLLETIRNEVKHTGATSITFRCSPYHQNSALYPVIEHLQRLLGWQPKESPATKLDKLEQLLQAYSLPEAEMVPLFAALLSLPVPAERYPPLNLSPQKQRQQTHDLLVTWLIEEAERQPVQVTWEDLHWADPSTLDFLGLVIEQSPTVRMLNVLTYRPEFRPPWVMRSHITPLTLNRLERLQVEALVTHHTAGKVLPAEVMQHVVSKTDGVPLFVEELTKTVLESDVLRQVDGCYELLGPLSTLTIPSTLQDSLMARLDRHPEVKEVAQLGAVLGREFTYETLKVLIPLEDTTLQDRLTQLVEAELLFQRGRPPRAKYIFKHALIQDVAYASLLKSTRQHYHQQIAELFEHQFPDIVETQPEVLAHHYTEAGLAEQAIPYWQQAGQRAVARSANVEAISHVTKGLDVLQTLPVSVERTQQELALHIALGVPLQTTKGWGDPELEKAYGRARELCQQQEETPQLPFVLFGLWSFYLVRADYKTALELGEQLFSLAKRQHDMALLIQAHHTLGATLLLLGELASAREHFDQVIALYDPQQHGSLAFQYGGYDPGMFCRADAAFALWLCGYPDQALRRSQEALSLARELPQPFTLAFAVQWAAMLRQLRGEHQQTLEGAEAAITLSKEQEFPYFLGWGTILQGWVGADRGDEKEATDQIRQGVALYRSTGSELWLTYILALQAEACGKVGQTEDGLATIAEALALIDTNAERLYEAELYRLKGELVLQSGAQSPESEAEACFQQAIDIARRQSAKSLELRAVMSLCRLRQQQGKRDEARHMLAEISAWFTEGFDTKDLQEANALLEGLER